jgi:hypothetical protein
VIGGLAVRLELTFDKLEDVQVALGALLDCCGEEDEVTIRVAFEGATLKLSVGPFDSEKLADELDREPTDGPSLERVLEAVADRVERVERDGGTWVELTTELESVDG